MILLLASSIDLIAVSTRYHLSLKLSTPIGRPMKRSEFEDLRLRHQQVLAAFVKNELSIGFTFASMRSTENAVKTILAIERLLDQVENVVLRNEIIRRSIRVEIARKYLATVMTVEITDSNTSQSPSGQPSSVA